MQAASRAAALAPVKAAADNLSDALIGAYRTSGLLEQNRALLRAADEDVAIALSQLRPVIEWTISASTSYNDARLDRTQNTLGTGIQLSQLLYDGGAAHLSKLAAQETVLATRQALLSIEQQVLLSAVQAYVDVLQAQENVSLRRNNLRLLNEELKAAQDRFDVGEVTRTDVALAESRVANARANLTLAEGILLTAKATYQQVVGRRRACWQASRPCPGTSPRSTARWQSRSATTRICCRSSMWSRPATTRSPPPPQAWARRCGCRRI